MSERAEIQCFKVTGDLVLELQPILAQGWWLVQVLAQPDESLVAIMQRPKRLIELAAPAFPMALAKT